MRLCRIKAGRGRATGAGITCCVALLLLVYVTSICGCRQSLTTPPLIIARPTKERPTPSSCVHSEKCGFEFDEISGRRRWSLSSSFVKSTPTRIALPYTLGCRGRALDYDLDGGPVPYLATAESGQLDCASNWPMHSSSLFSSNFTRALPTRGR